MSKIGQETNKPAEPREIDVIQAEFTKVCELLGAKNYEFKLQEHQLFNKLLELNQEGFNAKEREAKRAERAEKKEDNDAKA